MLDRNRRYVRMAISATRCLAAPPEYPRPCARGPQAWAGWGASPPDRESHRDHASVRGSRDRRHPARRLDLVVHRSHARPFHLLHGVPPHHAIIPIWPHALTARCAGPARSRPPSGNLRREHACGPHWTRLLRALLRLPGASAGRPSFVQRADLAFLASLLRAAWTARRTRICPAAVASRGLPIRIVTCPRSACSTLWR